MDVEKLLCIYHRGCMDGFGAAWVVRKYVNRLGIDIPVEYLPATYGDEPPDVMNRDVIIVDFSYSRKMMIEMAACASNITVLDHHASAEKNLAGLDFAHFDMDKSGCRMTWEYLMGAKSLFFAKPAHEPEPKQSMPLFLQYIEDRDLWLWQMDRSRAINAAMYSYPQDFDLWNTWEDPVKLIGLIREGEAINRARDKMLKSLTRGWMIDYAEIGGYTVPVVNCNHFFKSEVAGELAIGHPFAAIYFDSADKRSFDLRSIEGGIDVSEIARLYGGGGHKRAAGFTVDKPDIIKPISRSDLLGQEYLQG